MRCLNTVLLLVSLWYTSTGLKICDASQCLLESSDGIFEYRLHRRKIRSASLCDCTNIMFCIWHRVVAVDSALDNSSSAVMPGALTSLIIVIIFDFHSIHYSLGCGASCDPSDILA